MIVWDTNTIGAIALGVFIFGGIIGLIWWAEQVRWRK